MKNVLLIDSGSGGINILRECVKVAPKCNYLLFCDAYNIPYGEKSKQELIEITKNNLNKIYKFFKFDIVVLACNTLTATVLDEMRLSFPNIIFIGTVPAIKPAILENEKKDILLIATEATIKNNKLIKKYEDSGITFLSLNKLAVLIDENLDDLEKIKSYLAENIDPKFKAIVLGCTHYKAVVPLIKELYPDIKIYYSVKKFARRLLSFVQEENFINYQVQIFCEKEDLLGKFWWYYNSIE